MGFHVNDDMFGCYVKIRTGRGKDMHIYKVIGSIESNGYCDTPIMGGARSVWHCKSVPVLNVVHCGVSEDTVIRVALSDCEVIQQPNNPLTLEELREMDGEPVYLDFGDGGEWALVRVLQGKVFVIHKNAIPSPINILFECGGKAYRRKPEEVSEK